MDPRDQVQEKKDEWSVDILYTVRIINSM